MSKYLTMNKCRGLALLNLSLSNISKPLYFNKKEGNPSSMIFLFLAYRFSFLMVITELYIFLLGKLVIVLSLRLHFTRQFSTNK